METNLVQPAAYSNAGAVPCMIVSEDLEENNYERWSILMKHYLVAQDLWDVILLREMPKAENQRDWVKKNASALHAIKFSCRGESFDRIKKMNFAKDAWNALADLHNQPTEDASGGSEADTETWKRTLKISGSTEPVSLLKDIYLGNWNALKELDWKTEIIFPGGFTILHIATIAGHLNIVKELVKIATKEYLEKQDDTGDTALSLAACDNGKVKIAECLVQENNGLLTLRNNRGYIPLVVACINRKKDMVSYLYSVTPFSELLPENSNQGTLFVKYCVLNFMLDVVGLDVLFRCSPSAASREFITISELSNQPSLFPSGSSPLFVPGYLLYKCLPVVELPSPSDHALSTSRLEMYRRQVAWVEIMDRIWGLLYFQCRRPGHVKQIYHVKLTHAYANLVLRHWCEEISNYTDPTQLIESGAISAIFQAIKSGTTEIVIEILKAKPDLFCYNEKLSREILTSAIKYRQKRVLRFLYRIDAGKKALLSLRDEDGNNALHLVAKLPDHRFSDDVSFIAAWDMTREGKWFEEVKGYLPRWYHEAKNLYGESPDQVFDREHEKLAKEMEEWGKKTAGSFSIASVLIVTIMFAALFTVPGGNKQDTGMPILLHRKLFSGFLICDAVSFIAASTSLLGFLSVLTESHGRGIRRTVLFFDMMFAISTLIISITTMILAFIFALTMMLKSTWQVLPAIIMCPLVVFYAILFNRRLNKLQFFIMTFLVEEPSER